MKMKYTWLTAAVLTQGLLSLGTQADVVVSTNFDGRTLSGANNHIAGSLNWTTNGVADPGTMTSIRTQNNDANQSLFNNAIHPTVDMFAPAWNYGNNGGFWTTEIDLTVLPGFTVSLDDVTFDYHGVSGSGALQGVNRVADFIVTVLDPSGAIVSGGSIGNTDVLSPSGAAAPVVSTFGSPIALSAPGTYTVVIKAGEFGGVNETGNHAAIDNLVINGTVIPEPSSMALLTLGGLAMVRRRRA